MAGGFVSGKVSGLTGTELSFFESVTDALVPTTNRLPVDARDSGAARRLDELMRELEPGKRLQLRGLLALFYADLTARRVLPNGARNGEGVRERLATWADSPDYRQRSMFEALRSLVLLTHVGSPRVREALGIERGDVVLSRAGVEHPPDSRPATSDRLGDGPPDAAESSFIREELLSANHLAKKHVHPRLAKMLELAGMNTVFERASGAYLWDLGGRRYLDFVTGGGVHFIGRNHPRVLDSMRQALHPDLPNLCLVNASALGGKVAERLLRIAGPGFGKVFFANSGSEAVDLALRFARYVTGRRRFLHLSGAFHGRTWGAISVNGWAEMKAGMDPMLPECTPLRRDDLSQLARELAKGDVAAFVVEPVQGMTVEALDAGYLRQAAELCRKHGTLLVADEIQTGLGRCGSWFVSSALGLRPDLMTISKTLSGGLVPVSALAVSEAVYAKVYERFQSGPFYFSTFGENNLAMAASLAVLDVLEELDAPSLAQQLSGKLRSGLAELAARHDCIERVTGAGLMVGVYFRASKQLALGLQQRLLGAFDPAAFSAAINVALYAEHRVLVQVPGPGLCAIKLLPPVTASDSDLNEFLNALDATLTSYETSRGPAVSMAVSTAKNLVRSVPPAGRPLPRRTARDGRLFELGDYDGPISVEADVAVVGSGPGGALLAERLAARGKRVALLEAGPAVRLHELEEEAGPTLAKHFFENGLRVARGNLYMPTLQARVLGGGSVFNCAICTRMTHKTLSEWRVEHGLEWLTTDEAERHYHAAEELMGLRPTDAAIMGERNQLFRKGCEALGWKAEPVVRNTSGCRGSAQCFTGCPNGAKASMDRRSIPELLDAGGTVYTSVHVGRLRWRGRKVVGVAGSVAGRPSCSVEVHAPITVLAAGALGSPAIARASGVEHAGVGAGLRFHPGASVLALFDHQVDPWVGASQGYHCMDFCDDGIKLETLWATPELMSFRIPSSGPELSALLGEYPRSAVWDVFVSGEDSVGHIDRVGRARYDVAAGDVRRMREGMAKLAEIARAAGAREVVSGLRGVPTRLPASSAADAIRQVPLEVTRFPMASNHVFGTMAMGADPERYPVDPDFAVRGAEGLFACDTGVMPSSPRVNPMLTMWALSHRLAEVLSARS
ncbi:MAG: aminotransferase class III-fold pyridoxal phosphate-dependent enzyme [Myxococcales bacterium]|nr:aminotransferase class III-fold pyridoxal phosphate-dependent enzyme [Myxococcales bacterium]